jgi:hypothetical protein
MMGWMGLAHYIPSEYRDIWTFGGFAVIFTVLFMVDQIYMWITAPYLFIETILNPRIEKFMFYVKKPIITHQLPEHNQFQTIFQFAWPVKHPYYGKISSLSILHHGEREKRIQFQPGDAYYAGEKISHAQTTFMVLHERGGSPERGEPEPIFDLVWSTGDTEHPLAGKLSSRNFPDLKFLQKNVPGYKFEEKDHIQKIETKLLDLELDLQTEKREKLKYLGLWKRNKRARMIAEESFGSQKEETDIALSMSGKVREMAQDVMLSYVQAHGSIEAGLRALSKPKRIVIGKYVAMMVISLGILAYFTVYPDILEMIINRSTSLLSVPANQIFFLMASVAFGGIVYYLKWGRKR